MWTQLLEFGTELLKFFSMKRSSGKKISNLVKIYDNMTLLISDSSIERILIINAHNCGGKIRPEAHLTADVIHENYRAPMKSVKDSLQGIFLDENAIRVLNKMYMEKQISIVVDELPIGSLLKDIYDSAGIKFVQLHFLKESKKEFIFVSLASSTLTTFNKPKEKLLIRTQISSIKSLI